MAKKNEEIRIKYKIDVLAALNDIGYYPTRLRKEKLMGESYIQQLRHGELVSWKTIETICKLLHCQVGDIVEYCPLPEEENNAEESVELAEEA